MAHESFEDAETARIMNALFVNIKADREKMQAMRGDAARQSAMIGSMAAELAGLRQTVASAVSDVDMRVSLAANAALTIWSNMQGGGDPAAPAKRGPGRPPLKAVEGGANG
jgi:prophage DNA circulation protein